MAIESIDTIRPYIYCYPPFSIKWEPKEDARFENAPALPPAGKADYAFILHCLYCLADDGVAVVMAYPGILYRGNAEGKIRKWLVSQNYVEKIIQFPGKYFEDTTVPVCVLVLRKNKNSTDIIFQDKEKDLERTVSLDEVASNGYNLSVSSYVQEEKEIEVVSNSLMPKATASGRRLKPNGWIYSRIKQ